MLYTRRLADSPTDVREYRFLARAYLAARDYSEAGRVIAAGLALAPDDQLLLEARGEVRAATGDPEGALADWRPRGRSRPQPRPGLPQRVPAGAAGTAPGGPWRRGSSSSTGATRTTPR